MDKKRQYSNTLDEKRQSKRSTRQQTKQSVQTKSSSEEQMDSDDEIPSYFFTAPEKKHVIKLLKYQYKCLNDISNLKNDTKDERIGIFKIILTHIHEIYTDYSTIDDDDIIEKLKKCFIKDIDDNVQNKLNMRGDNKLLLDTSQKALGNGTWGSVLKLDGYANNIKIYSVACKLMHHYKFNVNEILYFILLQNKILKNKIPHFPLMYSYFYCNNDSTLTNLPHISNSNLPYFILLTELANGTLKDLIFSTIDKEAYLKILYNSFAQLIIAYCFFNKLGHLHKDSNNPANFLYKIIEIKDDKKYFKYNVKIDKNKKHTLYIENIGFLWLLNDFGTSIPSNIHNNDEINTDDIKGFFGGIQHWITYKKNSTIINEINNFIDDIFELVEESHNSLKIFISLLLNSEIIRNKMYIINNVHPDDVINPQGYDLDFTLNEIKDLPLFGYIDYK